MSVISDRPRFISTPSRGRGEYELKKIKNDIRERSNYTCDYCGDDANQVEHINPVSDQGINDPRNLIVACGECNREKQDKPVTEFLSDKTELSVSVRDLPIYGDLILNIPELPEIYRQVRRETIIEFRKEGNLTGSNAYKRLEKKFRRNLWRTDYGYWLCLRFPERSPIGSGVPGQQRVVRPLIEYVVSDTRKPIYDFFTILSESAATRQLIDDIVYYYTHQQLSVEEATRTTIDEVQPGIRDKLNEKVAGTGFEELADHHFQVPEQLDHVPVRERDLYIIDIDDFREAGGTIRGIVDGFKIRVPQGETGSDIPVQVTDIAAESAKAVPLSLQEALPIQYDEQKAIHLIRNFGQ